ncbi:uncharacterized protein APUU_40186S [Aspergillus puulaauensis]|uniref:F-box domain-containing protein n=1 Tax=Aspergillus puulaauensis TaxID=1220207 RepID=A0A7R8AMF8_9EURO|nr:uncharacterized protein APUU_40186S [Aspergillus puulaauensis]BCS23742.1 hypothetical protein APUU_40186S [Aspergillus puulaauensis]
MGGYDNGCAICGAKVEQLIYDDDDGDNVAHDDVDNNVDEESDDVNEEENDDDEGDDQDNDEDDNENNDDNEDSNNNDQGYDESLIKLKDVLWMKDVRVMSENREALSMNKVFISGLAQYDDWGFFDVEPGNHPNFPTREQMDYDRDGKVNLRCYDWGTDHAFAVAFHAPCLRILEEFVSMQLKAGKIIDEEILYQTFKDFVSEGDDFAQCLTKIDYGIDTTQQYWEPNRGEEYCVMNPMDIPQLQDYYDELPFLQDVDMDTKTHRDVSAAQLSNDPLARLPPELLFAILITLPMASVNSLRAASPAVARLELNNGFWKQKLRYDMPWLFDLPDDGDEELDWAKCYADLRARSQNGSPAQIRALVNRRRIWGVCEQFAPSYCRRKAVKDEERSRSQGSLLSQATSTPIRRLTSPQAKTDSLALALLRSLSDLDHELPTLSVFWTTKGALSGFGVQRANMDTIGSPEKFAIRDEVKVEKNDWIRGFIVTSTKADGDAARRKVVGLKVLFIHGEPIQLGQSNGDHILIHTETDRVLAGLLAQWSPGNPISGLSLLHVPVSKGFPHAAELAKAQAGKPESATGSGSRLWRDHLPPPEMTLSEERLGYWSLDFKGDMVPMEALVFGQDEDELAAITEVAGDVQFGAFEIRYTNKPTKTIGPRPLTMKSLPIDGPGGERIVAVGLTVGHITTSIRFITNYNRQLVLGSCQPNHRSETIYGSTEEKPFRGIYCNWSLRSSPKASLQCIAGLFSPSPEVSAGELPAGPQDTTSDDGPHWWEPCPPPAGWTAVGPIYGAHETPYNPLRPGVSYPTTSAVVAWVDCTRPVRKVQLNVAHRTSNLPFTPTSLILEYTDGSISSIGPIRLASPPDTDGENGFPWCWCSYDIKLPESESPLGKIPHYSAADEWSIEGGAVLDSCRLWVDDDGPLRGIQFVSTDGGESPRWGVCDGEPAVIGFGRQSDSEAGNRAVGLKVFLDSNQRPVTYPDTVIVGIQALAES